MKAGDEYDESDESLVLFHSDCVQCPSFLCLHGLPSLGQRVQSAGRAQANDILPGTRSFTVPWTVPVWG